MIRRLGKRSNLPLVSQSTIEKEQLAKVMVEPTAGGASAEVDGILDEEPMCMATTVPVSSQAARSGSQSSACMDGSPRWGGISENATARTPRAALRRTSAGASSASHSGMRVRGMRRPRASGPHHSSTIQSLYARTPRSPGSRSFASVNVCPQNRGKVGKQSADRTWWTSVSASRSGTEKEPGRICS